MSRRYPQEDPSRRDFFRHAACAAVGATALVSTVWDLRAINAAAADKIQPAANDYKALVCLFLYGGNDANNMVIPYDQTNYDKYAAARGVLGILRDNLTPLTLATADPNGRQYAFHPNCPELR